MSTINDGGPAFPTNEARRNCEGHIVRYVPVGGMSVRAYAATRALQGIIANAGAYIKDEDPVMLGRVADRAVRYADALIKRLEKP